MSRVAKKPVQLPTGVEVSIVDGTLTVKREKNILQQSIPSSVKVSEIDKSLRFEPKDSMPASDAKAGCLRAIAQNMVDGVSKGFERKLMLVGVGYKAQKQGASLLVLSLGYSHPINYTVPAGIVVETPSVTEIIIKGADKQQVGMIAAEIRGFRPPEPYKGKGVRYSDEKINLKEAKKK